MGPRFTCARCGEPIGVYEPILIVEPDGSARRSSYLEAREAADGSLDGCALVHATCQPAALPRHTIRTGEQVVIREIGPQDKPLLADAFEHLSDESRYKRFLAPIKYLSAGELDYLTQIDHSDHEALVACGLDGKPLGVARYVRVPDRPSEAEVAVAVVDEWQGRGVATALLEDLVAHAMCHKVTTFTALCLASNDDMFDLLSQVGEETSVRRSDAGTVELRVRLPLAADGRNAASRPPRGRGRPARDARRVRSFPRLNR